MAANNSTTVTEKVLRVKLLIDNKAKRVLFAEAEKDVIDFLFSLLSAPVSSIVKLMTEKSMIGSMGNLYKSVENISATYIQPNVDKNLILKPMVVPSAGNIPPLLPADIKSSSPKYYTCADDDNVVTNCFGATCPQCGEIMDIEMIYVTGGARNLELTDVGGYVKGQVTYMVTDELVVMPMSKISSITLLKKFNVVDLDCLEEKIVNFRTEEGLEVLKAALNSKYVLTDVFLGDKK